MLRPGLLLLLLAACDPLAGSDYRGEPQLILHGTIVDLPANPPARLTVSVVWGDCTERTQIGADGSLCIPDTEVTIDLTRGTSFDLPLYENPPASALIGPPGGRAAIGRLVLSDRPLRERDSILLGGGRHYEVSWNEGPITWDPTLYSGEGPPPPGYALWEDLACQQHLETGEWPTSGIRYRLVPGSEGPRVFFAPGTWPLGCG